MKNLKNIFGYALVILLLSCNSRDFDSEKLATFDCSFHKNHSVKNCVNKYSMLLNRLNKHFPDSRKEIFNATINTVKKLRQKGINTSALIVMQSVSDALPDGYFSALPYWSIMEAYSDSFKYNNFLTKDFTKSLKCMFEFFMEAEQNQKEKGKTVELVSESDKKSLIAKLMRNLFSVEIYPDSALFEYNSPREFNGDGYSLVVYALPSTIKLVFFKADKKFLESYPIRPDFRNDWECTCWTQTPFNKKYQKYLDFIFWSAGPDIEVQPKLSVYLNNMKTALFEPDNFYSFFYKNNGDSPCCMDFFFIDMHNKKLYIINSNT